MSKIYDVIVLGAGPAGLAAGLYAGRSRLSVLIVEKGQDGGQISITDEIENYPGQIVDQPESGPSLIARMTEQAKKFGAERVSDTIKEVSLEGEVKVLKGEKGEYQAKNIIIATGAHARPIGCKGEAEFLGRGVSYCATCDANFFEDFEVYVVGGGDSAVEEAMYLTKFARKVTIIHRRDELRAAKSIQEKAFKNDKLHFMWDTVVEEVGGDGILSWMTVKNVKTGEVTYAVRDTSINGITIKVDDIMGIDDDGIKKVGQDVEKVTLELLEEMVDEDSELISIYYGEDTTKEQAEALLEKVEETYGDCDVQLEYGGQPIYYFLLSVE